MTPWPLPGWGAGSPVARPGTNGRLGRSPATACGARALGPHCCFSSCVPCHVPKLLGQDEKDKYADMARAWRAAQGKDSGPLEKQVKVAGDEQLPARHPGTFRVLDERMGHVRADGWAVGVSQCRGFRFLPGVGRPVISPTGPLLGRTLVSFGGEGRGSPAREP